MFFSRPASGQSRSIATRARISAASKSNVEQLEKRSLLSVSLGSDGFTDITPSGDSKIIYVSSSNGSDSNNGSEGSPVKSIAKGMSLARSGYPDHILLKRGDSWTESNISWTKSGRSSQEPLLLGAYGSGERPLIKAGKNNGLQMASGNVNNIAIQGIHLFAHTRDPNGSGYSRTEGGYGIRFVAGTTSTLIEDTVIDQFGFNMLFQAFNSPQSNVTLRRNVITDAYSISGSHSSGIFAQGITNLTLTENVFDHNGWHDTAGGATAQNHNAYLSEKNNNVVIRGNVFANGSSHGLQTRAGGIVENNVFIRNPIHMSFGLVNGAALKAGGVTGSVKGNVFLESRNIGNSARGWAIDLGNIKSATVSDNIINNGTAARMGAIVLNPGSDLHNASQGVGINNLTIENNIVNNWYMAVQISGSMKPGGSGTTGLKNFTVRDNDFQYSYGPYNRLVSHPGSYSTTHENWSNNRYYDDASTNAWFFMGTSNTSLSEWQKKLEGSAKNAKVNYTNPNAGVNSYAGSYGAFMNDVRDQSAGNWEGGPAAGLINHVRKAFNQSTSPTPTPTPTTPEPTPEPTPTPTTPTPTDPPPASHEAPVIQIADAAIAEGNSGTQQMIFPVTLSGTSTATVTVKYATNNKTAGEGDYNKTSGTLTFAPGETAKSIAVEIKGDTRVEADDEFQINLSSPSNATLGRIQVWGTILNDDGGVVPTVPTPTPTPTTPTPTPTPTSTVDKTRPTVVSFSGNSTTLKIKFSENVGASLTAKDLSLTHPSKGLEVYNSLKLSYDSSTNTATWTWSGVGKLQSGTWRAALKASTVSDAAGNTLASDYVKTFTV